jgi:hypothetical protein
MNLLKEDDNCFRVKRMRLSHQDVTIEAVQAHINNRLFTFSGVVPNKETTRRSQLLEFGW